MTSFLLSSLLLLLARDALAVPAPQAAQVTPAPNQAQAEAQLAADFDAQQAAISSYQDIPIQTSLSPEELAAEASLLKYYATASFSDIPFATDIPASLLADITGPSGVEFAVPRQTDPCGPAVQDGSNFDTCTIHPDGTENTEGSPYVFYSTEPSYYGVQCMPVPGTTNTSVGTAGGPDGNLPSLNVDNCDFEGLCAQIQSPDYVRGIWHWNTDGGEGCAVGVWLPDGEGVARTPDKTRCRDAIYGTMGLYCSEGGFQSQVGAVNLVTLPGAGGREARRMWGIRVISLRRRCWLDGEVGVGGGVVRVCF